MRGRRRFAECLVHHVLLPVASGHKRGKTQGDKKVKNNFSNQGTMSLHRAANIEGGSWMFPKAKSRRLPAGAHSIACFIVMAAALAAGVGAAHAQGGVISQEWEADPLVFDANFYLKFYPDLRSFFGNDTAAARQHWLTRGLPNEGRRGSREFNVQFYLNNYLDLRHAFGLDYRAAVDHWLHQGLPNEGRRGSQEFDVNFYLYAYSDLRASFSQILRLGHTGPLLDSYPGKLGCARIEVTAYYPLYYDAVFRCSEYLKAFDHWVFSGSNEGRKGAP